MAERETLSRELAEVKGAQNLLDWFGYWPNFHDAEVISVHLNRAGQSSLAVHVWQMTDRVDAHGFFVRRKHAVVTFLLSGISELELAEFNHQNVLGCLNLTSKDSAFELTLQPIYGLAGKVTAQQVEITFVPGEPAEVGLQNDAGRPTRGRARPLTKAEQLRLKSET